MPWPGMIGLEGPIRHGPAQAGEAAVHLRRHRPGDRSTAPAGSAGHSPASGARSATVFRDRKGVPDHQAAIDQRGGSGRTARGRGCSAPCRAGEARSSPPRIPGRRRGRPARRAATRSNRPCCPDGDFFSGGAWRGPPGWDGWGEPAGIGKRAGIAALMAGRGPAIKLPRPPVRPAPLPLRSRPMPLTGRFAETADAAIPLVPIAKAGLEDWLGAADPAEAPGCGATGFQGPARASWRWFPVPGGGLATRARRHRERGPGCGRWPACRRSCRGQLTPWRRRPGGGRPDAPGARLGARRLSIDRYRKAEAGKAVLVWPEGCDRAAVENLAASIGLVRDLINTPAADMGPVELAESTNTVAAEFGATVRITEGDAPPGGELPDDPRGRAGGRPRAPRLIEMEWGEARHPAGGGDWQRRRVRHRRARSQALERHAADERRTMGGAAHALGLARLIMAAGLSGAPAPPDPGGGERGLRQRFRPMDIPHQPQGHDGRDRQHGCGKVGWSSPTRITRAGEDQPVC